MSVLDSIIRFKELESAKVRADIGMIGNAYQAFEQGRKTNLLLQLEKRKLDVELGVKGLRFSDEGQIVPATNLIEALGLKKMSLADIMGGQGVNSGVAETTTPTNSSYLIEELSVPTAEGVDVKLKRRKTEQEKQEEILDLQNKEIVKGVSGEVGGRVALAKESIKNIQDIKKILFPDGTAKSFKRTTAFASNLPGGTAPIIGAVLPQRAWGKAEQSVFRKMGAALSGRQLIQTGVAARPEETAKLVAQFAPSGGSNPQAALDGLNELEDFYVSYLQQTVPEERFNKTKNSELNLYKSKYGLE